MSVQPVLFDRLNSAFHHRQYISERLMDSESIKSNDIVALYSNIMTASSASVIYKMLMSVFKAFNVL